MAVEKEKKRKQSTDDYGELDDNGVDLSLIRMNLRLTPAALVNKVVFSE